jgi:hypothetical protein
MVMDLKPLDNENIHKLGYSTHDLWIVKVDNEIFGPFEIDSLQEYASKNEIEFQTAQASRMHRIDWHPFYFFAQFQNLFKNPLQEQVVIEKFWILVNGQKTGPLTRVDIEKKFELELVNINDLVSLDNGESWQKFYNLEGFGLGGGVDALPIPPTESSFAKAREEVQEKIESHSNFAPKLGLAGMAYLGQGNEKSGPKLEEIDLKSLKVSDEGMPFKKMIASAVVGLGVIVLIGNYLTTPSVTDIEGMNIEKTKFESSASIKNQSTRSNTNSQRRPASYNAFQHAQGSQAPFLHSEPYRSQTETHYNEPDPMVDPASEAEQPQENSLVDSTPPEQPETLDQAMNEAPTPEAAPEQPVVEEVGDF